MFEKALQADLSTINAIIDKVFPQVSTSFTLQEILTYAAAYSEYTLGDNMGFPADNTTDTLSGLGSIVIPQDLASNVSQLHEFLFGTVDYTPSSTVQTINANIISTVNSAGTASSASYPEEGYYEDASGYDSEDDYYYEENYSDNSEDYGSGGYEESYGEAAETPEEEVLGNGGQETGNETGTGTEGGTGAGDETGTGGTGVGVTGTGGNETGAESGSDTGGTAGSSEGTGA